MRAHKLCLYIIVSGLVFFPAVFDNCSIHDPERNHQWELMSVPLRLALLRGGAGTGAARSCNACSCTGGGVAAGCRWGRGERAGVMPAGTCGLQRQPSRPSVSPGRQPRPRPEPCAQGPEVTGRHPPAQPSAVSASCGPSHRGVCCGFVVCERTGRSESGTVKGQLVLCLSGRGGGKGGRRERQPGGSLRTAD